jgi:hypothetical protein
LTLDETQTSKLVAFPSPGELTKAARAVEVASRLLGARPWFVGARVEVQRGCVYVLALTTRYDAQVRVCVPWSVEGVGVAVRAIGLTQAAPRR